MKYKPSSRKRQTHSQSSPKSNSDRLVAAVNNDMRKFVDFADAHFDPLWHLSQPPLLRATLSLMTDELIAVARTTIEDVYEAESFRTVGTTTECAFGTIFKHMRDGTFGHILTQIDVSECTNWIFRFAVGSGES